MTDKEKSDYGASIGGNFFVIDTITLPHPFMIAAGHVSYASDHGGMLTPDIIRSSGIPCAACKQGYDKHDHALLIGCRTEIKDESGKANLELHEYLLRIKDKAAKDGFAGFAFKRVI